MTPSRDESKMVPSRILSKSCCTLLLSSGAQSRGSINAAAGGSIPLLAFGPIFMISATCWVGEAQQPQQWWQPSLPNGKRHKYINRTLYINKYRVHRMAVSVLERKIRGRGKVWLRDREGLLSGPGAQEGSLPCRK